MRRRFLHRIVFLLTAIVCVALLTGCPNISEEKLEQLKKDGRAILKQELQDTYGWGEADYQILTEEVTPKSAQGFDSVKYQLNVGDKIVTADVNIDLKEVYTDYYGKEFEETLTAYLDRKMEGSQVFREMALRRMSVSFNPLSDGFCYMATGTIPASLTPEGFEAYLEKCEQERVLNVALKVAWYSKEPKVPENLLRQLSKSRIPNSLIVEHFAVESDETVQLTDWAETCVFDADGGTDHSIYEYLQVKEDLFIRRTYSSYEEMEAADGTGIYAVFDSDGHLHITPGDQYYYLFLKNPKEGTVIRDAYEEGAAPTDYCDVPWKNEYFDDWYIDGVMGWNIVIEEK